MGTIWVSVRRGKLRNSPCTFLAPSVPITPLAICSDHFQREIDAVKCTIREVLQAELIQMDTMVMHPDPETFEYLESPQGNWMNSVFLYRARGIQQKPTSSKTSTLTRTCRAITKNHQRLHGAGATVGVKDAARREPKVLRHIGKCASNSTLTRDRNC